MNCKSLYQNITRNIVIIWISNAERSIGGWLVQNVKELIIFIPYEWTTYTFCITATVGFHNFCFWILLFRKLGKLTCPLISICYSVTTFWEFQHFLMNMLSRSRQAFRIEEARFNTYRGSRSNIWSTCSLVTVFLL